MKRLQLKHLRGGVRHKSGVIRLVWPTSRLNNTENSLIGHQFPIFYRAIRKQILKRSCRLHCVVLSQYSQ